MSHHPRCPSLSESVRVYPSLSEACKKVGMYKKSPGGKQNKKTRKHIFTFFSFSSCFPCFFLHFLLSEFLTLILTLRRRARSTRERSPIFCAGAGDVARDLLLRKLLGSTNRPSVGAVTQTSDLCTRHSVASAQVKLKAV